VLLDVAYNHTGESDELGPTICYRGIDNLSYYRTASRDPGKYLNHSGCGNTINTDHPRVRALILDSMRYWSQEMGVDGFRFDLATVLGRTEKGYTSEHPLWLAIDDDKHLASLKLIAEPWDPGHEGYQLGQLPVPFAEWNDRYRDSVRRFWRGDSGEAAELAGRLLGSADLFEAGGKGPANSINLLTAHDGFTLSDVVSYEHRHNHTNGEQNRDGHRHNFSCNYGTEGTTTDESINATRRKQRLNMLATLFFSQGTPMLLGGDEFGHSQSGNNNAYAQDNDTGWLDWAALDDDPEFNSAVRTIIRLRRTTPLLRQAGYLHGQLRNHDGWPDVAWLRPDGAAMQPADWPEADAFSVVLASPSGIGPTRAVALLLNPTTFGVDFQLPEPGAAETWQIGFSTDSALRSRLNECQLSLSKRSVALLILADAGTHQ
jgi:isoamylase